MKYLRFKAKQEFDLQRGQLKEMTEDEHAISDNIVFTEQTEKKFFKLLNVLVKNSDHNLILLKKIKNEMSDYKF